MVEESEIQHPLESIEMKHWRPDLWRFKSFGLEWFGGLTAKAQDLS
jgi:hypothetical protein